jgi:hypothetical protein
VVPTPISASLSHNKINLEGISKIARWSRFAGVFYFGCRGIWFYNSLL